jgi:hypothetical protein
VLRAGGRVVDVTRSGRLGRYRLHFAPAGPGRYRLTVSAGSRSRPVGTLDVRPVVVEAVGDITFGEQVGPAISVHGARYPWTYVAPALRPLHGLAGFDVLTLANNHAVDYGRDALVDTVESVHVAGMKTIGAGANATVARRPAVVERGGLRIAFLGYSDVNPLGFTATSDLPGTARADVTAITADVRGALRRADVAVCYFHWGTELHSEPDSRQQTFANACLAAGAKIVLGAHPHVLGAVVPAPRRSLVAWTLGNFVFPSSGVTARTAILRVGVDGRGVAFHRLLPVTIDGFRPRLR